MKVILILMTILQIGSFWRMFVGLFKSHKVKMLELKNSMAEAKEKAANVLGDDAIDGLAIMSMFIYALFLTLYYILAGIYVNQVIFVILSCLFIIQSWKSMWIATNWFIDKDDSIFKTTFMDSVFSVVNLIYIGYLVYYLVIK